MNILHYTLGLPTVRSGGLTKYATDLMIMQSERHTVTLLYPGGYNPFIRSKELIHKPAYGKIQVYAMQNPVIVPILYGISNPYAIINDSKHISREELESFYRQVRPDILHLHTMMGLSLEFLLFLKEKGVKVVYTSHDYFGLCPKVNFINQEGLLCPEASGERCALCNATAPSSTFLRIRNSQWLLSLKNNQWLRKIRK